jgi:hypothetical protein
MSIVRILHVTDFHLSDPEGTKEHLRKAHFRTFINRLRDEIQAAVPGKVDCLVATGDFVDRGSAENFSHATTILDYFAQAFSVKRKDIAVCIGNHDLDRSRPAGSEREAFDTFSSAFSNGLDCQHRDTRSTLCRLGNGLRVLSLDTTLVKSLPARDADLPGDLDQTEIDALLGLLETFPSRAPLLVLTHYPIFQHEMGPNFVGGDVERNWAERHFYSHGNRLAKLLREDASRGDQLTVWFHGDVHKSYQHAERNHHYLTTGRLGTRVAGDHEPFRHARVVCLDTETSAVVENWLAVYECESGIPATSLGEWKAHQCSTPQAGATMSQELATGDATLLPAAGPSTTGPRPVSVPAGVVQRIEEKLETDIMGYVREGDLCHMGRFR